MNGTGDYIAFIPDGRLVVSKRKITEVIDPDTGRPIHDFGNLLQGALGFSRNGRWLAVSKGKTVQILDLSTERVAYTLPPQKDNIGRVALSYDGHWLACGAPNGISLWELPAIKQVRTFPSGESMAFSPDGKTLASVDAKTITLWDLATGKSVRTFPGTKPVVFSPDGRLIASLREDTITTKVWDLSTGEEVGDLGGRSGWTTSLAFSADGQWLASGDSNDTVWLWRRTN